MRQPLQFPRPASGIPRLAKRTFFVESSKTGTIAPVNSGEAALFTRSHRPSRRCHRLTNALRFNRRRCCRHRRLHDDRGKDVKGANSWNIVSAGASRR
ncbi:hypothetical protein [Rhodocyclus tenuis]|uniref:Uncharacterized protein n=1 Tax=Rhodocyclus tenuis TaxID=1066 RepID=A0A840G6K9_RHOTE|nr:hypothetical protein [Rhodocyclus tenuis]MBB4247506.1 hypothetical protein [Rhodocyclus tenuis]